MAKIKFNGWEPGARKIKFTMLLYHEAGLSLAEAKKIKDRVIDNDETVEILIHNWETASEIQRKAIKLGIKSEIIDDSFIDE